MSEEFRLWSKEELRAAQKKSEAAAEARRREFEAEEERSEARFAGVMEAWTRVREVEKSMIDYVRTLALGGDTLAASLVEECDRMREVAEVASSLSNEASNVWFAKMKAEREAFEREMRGE